MKPQNTNEFNKVRRSKSGTNTILLSVGAVLIALIAIIIAILLSIWVNVSGIASNAEKGDAADADVSIGCVDDSIDDTLHKIIDKIFVKDSSDKPTSSILNILHGLVDRIFYKEPSKLPSDTDQTTPPSPETTVPAPEETTAPSETTNLVRPGNDTTTPDQPDKKPPVKVEGKFTICIDPGHGYDDPGTVSEYLGDVTESEITMDIANHLKEILTSYGYNIVMTHEDNTPPAGTYGQYLFNPKKRIAYANENFDYDYYISVHCNSYPESYVNGTRIYYHAPKNANNAVITNVAECLKGGIASALPDSKIPSLHPLDTADAYYVCRYAESLATMLVETGFVTNPDDAAKMLDDNWKKAMAQGIADGIHAYLSNLD